MIEKIKNLLSSTLIWPMTVAWCLFISNFTYAAHLQVKPTNHMAMKLMIRYKGDDAPMRDIVSVIKKDLEFKKLFNVSTEPLIESVSKKEIADYHKQGYLAAVFLESDSHSITWRVYSTQNGTMLMGKKYNKQGSVPRGWAHAISDRLWSALTGDEGFFSTKLAYCQNRYQKNSAGSLELCKDIYMCDYDGSHSECMVKASRAHVAPRWNADFNDPLLFCSEHTPSNVRLLAVNMDKKRKVVSNFDGVNMLPTFSSDGKKAVYCASRGNGKCNIYHFTKGELKRLTNNQGNNVSPVFSSDTNKIFFCSDYQGGSPAVYVHSIDSGEVERITASGYCSSPSYCEKKNMLAYSKMINGVNQIFTYNVASKVHTQITFDAGSKEECCWSPCGTMIIFCSRQGMKSQLVMHDMHTRKEQIISGDGLGCSYPAWSRIYKEFPSVC